MSFKQLQLALEEFYRDAQAGHTVEQKSEQTIKNIKGAWRLFLRVTDIEYCHQITEAVLRRYFNWGIEEKKWKPMTTRSHRKNLSVFIRWAVIRKYLTNNPLLKIPKPKLMKRLPRHHTDKEVEVIFQAIEMRSRTSFEEARNKAIIGVAALAGLRRGEAMNLTLNDINMESRQIRVKAETSKSRSERMVPIVQRLHDMLKSYFTLRDEVARSDCNYLWASSVTGNKLSIYGLTHVVDQVSKSAGFRVKMHSLRHSYGTYSYAGCHDIKAVQENMGHSDLSTTLIYVNSLSEDKRHAAEMSPLNRV